MGRKESNQNKTNQTNIRFVFDSIAFRWKNIVDLIYCNL